jgi:hypothetical protein
MKSIRKSAGSQIEIGKSISAVLSEISFLEKFIYHGLSIFMLRDFTDFLYFRTEDFKTILERIEKFGVGVRTIYAYNVNAEQYCFYDNFGTYSSKEFQSENPMNPSWYRAAFASLEDTDYEQEFSIIPFYPKGLLKYYAYESND